MARKAARPTKKAPKPKSKGTKAVATKRSRASKTTARTRPSARTAAAAAAPRKSGAGESLGRPLVTAEEKLYLLFKEDFHARQIFEFLRVGTVGELERFSPQEIIKILSTPLRETVERIRERLAQNKRHLRDDVDFARERLSARAAQ